MVRGPLWLGVAARWASAAGGAARPLLASAATDHTHCLSMLLFLSEGVLQGSPEAGVVRGPLWLGVAARWASAAGGATRPLLASAATDHTHCLLLGVPPRYQHEPRKSVFMLTLQHAL